SEAVKAPNGEMAVVEYSPFVFQVNPNKGGRSVQPAITGITDKTKLTMDYRRTFNYYNFFGTHINGQPNVANSFLHNLWDKYAESRGANPNYGSRDPLSYYGNKNNTSL